MNKKESEDKWIIEDIADVVSKKLGYKSKSDLMNKYAEKDLSSEIIEEILLKEEAEYALEHADTVYQSTAIGNKAGTQVVEAKAKSQKNPDKIYKVEREGHYTVYILNGREMAFYSSKIRDNHKAWTKCHDLLCDSCLEAIVV